MNNHIRGKSFVIRHCGPAAPSFVISPSRTLAADLHERQRFARHSSFVIRHSSFAVRAFTLVELLVVIAIIGILVALLLPAIQAAREAARRAQCSNNLRNLAVGAVTYHDAHKHFPVDEDIYSDPPDNYDLRTGRWIDSGAPDKFFDAGVLSGAGWIVMVLPQMEEQALFDRFEPYLDKKWFIVQEGLNKNDPQLREALAVQPPILLCPSEELIGPRTDQFPYNSGAHVTGPPWTVAVTSYKGNAADTAYVSSDDQPPFNEPTGYWSGLLGPPPLKFDCHYARDCFGIFWRYTYARGGVKMKEITDGTSNTFLVGETSPIDGRSVAYNSEGDWAITGVQINFDWRSYPACNPNPTTGTPACWWNMLGFRSSHPGGVHFAFADASVQFIQDEIDHPVYRALSSRAKADFTGEY